MPKPSFSKRSNCQQETDLNFCAPSAWTVKPCAAGWKRCSPPTAKREISIPQKSGVHLRLARFFRGGQVVLLTNSTWSSELKASDNSGTLYVIGIQKGEIIASVSGQGAYPEVASTPGKTATAPRLLVATGGKLNAFRVTNPK